MKKYFASLFLVLTLHAWCAVTALAQNPIDTNKLGLLRTDFDHNAVLPLGGSRSTAIAALGNPTTITSEYSELDDKNLDVWHYGGATLYFRDDALIAYNLDDATLGVGQSFSTAFKIGDLIPSRQIRVPDTSGGTRNGTYTYKTIYSFSGYSLSETPGKTRNRNYNFLAQAYLSTNSSATDGFSEVLFLTSGKISNIYTRQE